MFNIVLVHPEIPPNAGNVIRLAANTGSRLHLVEPLGFTLEDRQLRRAGLDYHDMARVEVHRDWEACRAALGERRLFAFSTRGARATPRSSSASAMRSSSAPRPRDCRLRCSRSSRPMTGLRLPMLAGNRSINLSNTVAVVVFEAWRQIGFLGSA